ncbi:MAG TPA: hypothetical protein VKR80_08640 [Candidatus Limnocylindria bacterium]|nr:hypothetical protein [Candidatus Limnocylindria bacterium]
MARAGVSRMDAASIERAISESESAVSSDAKPDLARLGFWKAVAAVKRDPALVDRYADRIARIDRAAFERSVPIRVPLPVGIAVDVVGAAIGLALLAAAPTFGPPWRELVFLAGFGGLLIVTHTLAHWVVGTLVGIRFTQAFMVPPKKPQPGFKIDYASYLRTPARARAWMHAAGAIVTKVLPFALVPFALRVGLETWAVGLLIVIGVLQILTDVLWSVRASDWKKFRREMRAARG